MSRYRLGVDSRIARPLTLAAAGVAAFGVVLVCAYFIGPIARWDATALYGLESLSVEHRWIWIIGDGLAHSIDLPWLMMGLLAVCGAGVLWGRKRQAVGAVVLVAVACLTSQLIKVAAAHPRYQPILLHQLPDTAFPSGHATAAMSLALAAALVAPSRWRVPTAIVGGSFVLAVSLALMIQGWHFPSDVLAGLLISTTTSLLVLAGLRATGLRATGGIRSAAGAPLERRFPARSLGVRALELLAITAALAVALLVVTHPNALTSYAATHTTGVIAAIGIAVASISLVYAVTAELEAR
jgi:membrane-associated phospholipid phosphatase